MELYEYKVGDKILPATGGDSVRFQLSDDGCTLLIQYNKPSAAEKRNFKQPAQFGMTIVKGVIFFLARFGAAQWMDAPFDAKKATFTKLDYPKDGEGLALHVVVVDSSTGILVSQRLIGLETDLSRRIIAAATYQPEIPNFDLLVSSIYTRYTTNDLVELAKRKEAVL